MTELVKNVMDIGRGILVATCVECGERVTMTKFDSEYKHQVILEQTFHTNGQPLMTKSQRVAECAETYKGYCPECEHYTCHCEEYNLA